MTITTTARSNPAADLRLSPHAVAVPALASQVRPSLVLAERDTRALIAAATYSDVAHGGRFSAGPAGVQVWSGPFDGPHGSHGGAVHLGSVDWSYDTPVRHYATIYRTMVTAPGRDSGETTESILRAVLALVGMSTDGTRLEQAAPPQRDPFRDRVSSAPCFA
ncbi:MAG TPA: hypothetical protein VNB94_10875 [Mycobacteriales bacterium]|nr:hypothetical protein [Mycobacteriales bacterium]